LGFSYVASDNIRNDASGTTLAVAELFDVNAGDLLVCMASWETTDVGTATVADAEATNSMTLLARTTYNSQCLAFGYKLVASFNDDSVFTLTLDAARTYRSVAVFQYRPDAGDTVSVDAGPNVGTGNTDSPTSGNINTSETDEVIFGSMKEYSGKNISLTQIADINSDHVETSGQLFAMWDKLFASDPGDGIHSQCFFVGGTSQWICDILAFKSVAAAGGSTIPRYKKYYDYRRAQ